MLEYFFFFLLFFILFREFYFYKNSFLLCFKIYVFVCNSFKFCIVLSVINVVVVVSINIFGFWNVSVECFDSEFVRIKIQPLVHLGFSVSTRFSYIGRLISNRIKAETDSSSVVLFNNELQFSAIQWVNHAITLPYTRV